MHILATGPELQAVRGGSLRGYIIVSSLDSQLKTLEAFNIPAEIINQQTWDCLFLSFSILQATMEMDNSVSINFFLVSIFPSWMES